MTSFTNKIDEWMKEAEERPESAVMIVRLIARRVRELTEPDKELLAKNIALQMARAWRNIRSALPINLFFGVFLPRF